MRSPQLFIFRNNLCETYEIVGGFSIIIFLNAPSFSHPSSVVCPNQPPPPQKKKKRGGKKRKDKKKRGRGGSKGGSRLGDRHTRGLQHARSCGSRSRAGVSPWMGHCPEQLPGHVGLLLGLGPHLTRAVPSARRISVGTT